MITTIDALPLRAKTTVLLDELSRLLRDEGDEPVVLLRSMPDCFDPDRDDIDLLLTPARRERLLHAALDATADGRLNFAARQSSTDKMRLTLWTTDARERLEIDLWSAFTQLPRHGGRRRLIPAEQLLTPLLSASDLLPGAKALAADVEFCLLVLHLAAKSKPLRSSTVRARLHRSAARLSASDDNSRLTECANRLTCAITINPDDIQLAEETLLLHARPERVRHRSRQPLRVLATLRGWWHRRTRTVAIVGSDGSGKTSLCDALATHAATTWQPVVAKKLFRRSWTWQLISRAIRAWTGETRSEVEDRAASLITLRAALGLWMRQSAMIVSNLIRAATGRAGQRLVLDRSVAGLLITQRTTRPELHASSVSESLAPPVTTVILALPFDTLTQRRREFQSAHAHRDYQRLLLEQALRQQPVDMIALGPASHADESAARLLRMLEPHGRLAIHINPFRMIETDAQSVVPRRFVHDVEVAA